MSEGTQNSASTQRDRRPTLLLFVGAAMGLGLAAFGLVGDSESRRLPGSAIARVNGTLIRGADYERLVAAVLEDMQTPDDSAARERVLERMIDEELLVQRALDLGLVHLDRKVRADLTSSVINAVVNDVAVEEPSERELRDFYSEHQSYFTRPGRMRVEQIFFRAQRRGGLKGGGLEGGGLEDGGAPKIGGEERAGRAHALLVAGEDWDIVKAEWGDDEIAPLPYAMLPAAKIREYVGPTVLRSASLLEVGQWGPRCCAVHLCSRWGR